MKTKRELPRTPLALAVMNLLMERPMHPYEMKLKMKERGHDQVIRIKGGSIYDTTDGNTYRLNATLNPDGTLHARIFRGVPLFGKTEILRRVKAGSQPGWC